MAFNNAINAKQQGTQYLSTGGAWSGVDASTAGFVLTSNGTGIAPSFQAAASGTYYSLTPYIVGSDSHSQYTTISAAITQAVSDGASSSSQKNIYVKPGTYNENLTVSDGINVIAIDSVGTVTALQNSSPFTTFYPVPGVILIGKISISSGSSKVQNLNLAPGSGTDVIASAGGVLELVNCYSNFTNSNLVNCTASGNVTINGGYYKSNGTATTCTVGSSQTLNLLINDSVLETASTTSSVVGSGATLSLNVFSSYIVIPLLDATASTATCSIVGYYSHLQVAGGGGVLINAYQGGFSLTKCRVISRFKYSNTVSGPGAILIDCEYPVSAITTTDLPSGTAIQYVGDVAGNPYQQVSTGFQGSAWNQNQAQASSATASTFNLSTITIPSGASMTVMGTISAQNATSPPSDVTGGNFMATYSNFSGTAALVGNPVVNVNQTSTGTFTLDASGVTARIRCTAPSSSTYNWVTTYSYQFVQGSA